MRQIIAVDIDNVLAAGSEGFIEYSNDRWGTKLTIQDYDEDFTAVWKVSIDEAMIRVAEYMESGAHGRFRHIEEALPTLQKLAEHFDLVIITSRRAILKEETDAWIATHFPNIFKEIVYAGIFDGMEGDDDPRHRLVRTKATILAELGATYLIDDQPKHCFGAAEIGVQSLLFGDYPWNTSLAVLPQNVIRVSSWDEVERFFSEIG